MGPLDAVIQLLLFVCFGVYVVMGLTFLIMGIIYHSDEGAVGSTGIYLILLGLLMLIIGGIAVFANLKKIWLILFVIELVNVALFLVRCWLLSALPQQALSRPVSAHRCSCSGRPTDGPCAVAACADHFRPDRVCTHDGDRHNGPRPPCH